MSGGIEAFEHKLDTPLVWEDSRWYAIQVRPRHEKAVARELQGRGVTTFLPLVTEVHGWSDRRKLVELPLFPCYAFVRITLSPEVRVRVLRIEGVLSFVGIRNQPTPIPDEQISGVQMLLETSVPFSTCPFLHVGQRVRIRSGALEGMEGILLSRNRDRSLVISVELIQRSLAIRIEGYDLQAI